MLFYTYKNEVFFLVVRLTDPTQTHANDRRVKVGAPFKRPRNRFLNRVQPRAFLFRWSVLLSCIAAVNIRDPLHKSRHPRVQLSDLPKRALTLGDEYVRRHATLATSDHCLSSSAPRGRFTRTMGQYWQTRTTSRTNSLPRRVQIAPFNGCSDMRRASS